MAKRGVEFERLVQWIASTIFDGATVTPNAEVLDVDSGKPREVDVLIEQRCGLVQVRVIGEVRDRAGRQDVLWVEQLHSKMRSVRASMAFAVSSSGFSAPAVAKASALNIQLYSWESAIGTRWADLVRPTTVDIISPSVSLDLSLLDDRTHTSFAPDARSLRVWAVNGPPPYTRADLDGAKHPLAADIAAMYRRSVVSTSQLRKGRGACQIATFDHVLLAGRTRFRDVYGNARRVSEVIVTATVTNVVRPQPLGLMVLLDPQAGESRVQVFRAEVQLPEGRFVLEMLTEGSGAFVPAGSKVGFRLTPTDSRAVECYGGFEVELSESGPVRDDGYTPLTINFTITPRTTGGSPHETTAT